MNFFDKQKFFSLFLKNFNLCFFISLVILSILPNPEIFIQKYPEHRWFLYFIIPAINGFLSTLTMLFLNKYFAHKKYTQRYYTQNKISLIITSFCAGFLSVYLSLSDIGTHIISLGIIYISICNIRCFAGRISTLLEPDKMATTQDLAEFANFFISLIITFTVINLSLNTLHSQFSSVAAFNFDSGIKGILDALYFSIITITTVGYGHIIPHTIIARVAVSVECLTGYIMLGIMIGIIGRGIKLSK